MTEIKHFEHPTLKVPYELLNKRFRTCQKNLDRDVAHVTTTIGEVESALKNESLVKSDVKAVLSDLQSKLLVFKKKKDESIDSEVTSANVCKRRLEHLKSGNDARPDTQAQWKRKRLDRMMVEYFLREGYYNTALELAQSSNIEDLTSLELFMVAKSIEESLQRHDTSKCLNWCHENKSKLRRTKSTLEFNLRQQEFIELVRNSEYVAAVTHAKKYLSSGDVEQMADVQRTMGLLGFLPEMQVGFYSDLLDQNRWQWLVLQFRQENFKLYQLAEHSVFGVSLQTGLSALKTPQCYEDEDQRNPECPVCSKHLNPLAAFLPFAHCASSRLICHLSGEPMDENNPPTMLPNGKVYSYNALASMAVENKGQITCPRTKESFPLSDSLKVFVM